VAVTTTPTPAIAYDLVSTVLLGITTCQRPLLLERLLQSLAACEGLESCFDRVVIIDNEAPGTAAEVARTARLSIPIDYRVEHTRGFSSARNAVLDARAPGEAVCFIDDDEVATAGWAMAMQQAHIAHPRDVIMGSTRVEHDGWPRQGTQLPEGSLIRHNHASTGNTLFPSWLWDDATLRFDPRFDRSGSEDLDLLLRIEDLGGAIRWWPSAACIEPAQPERAGFDNYLMVLEAAAARYAGIMRERRERRLRLTASGLWKTTSGSVIAAVTRGDRRDEARRVAILGRGILTGLTTPLNLESRYKRNQ